MNNEILLSIIIPVYNVEPFLEDCIRSVERIKTSKEVICINDGSTDNSLLCLQKLSDEFDDILIIQQENSGVSSARNKGISLAKGKYICFFDADDMVIAETIDKAVLLLEEEQIDCITYGHKEIVEDSSFHNFFDLYSEKQGDGFSYDVKKPYNKPYIWAFIIKKEIINKNSIVFQNMRYFEDQCFVREICVACPKTITLTDFGYLYRKRSSSAMYSQSKYKFGAIDAIKGAMYIKKLEEKTTDKEIKADCRTQAQLLVLHAMTMGIQASEFDAQWVLKELENNNLFPFKPMWRLLVPNGKSTVLNFLRFGFFSKKYYSLFFKLTRIIKKIK